MNHLEFGALGEQLAARHMERLGWRIIGKNISIGKGELDIAAMDGDELVIVEVRSRKIGELSPSEATVGPRKIKTILKVARKFVERISYNGNWRIDVAAVTMERDGTLRVDLFSDVTMGMEGLQAR
ncbi:MAG: YraN family protein [Synergistaceae bacterium]|jgi:putative endonuclease|nr:YraN family protein [Synergistaceae bacterium]